MARSQKERSIDRLGKFYDHVTPDASEAENNFRHGHWRHRRALITQQLEAAGTNAITLNRWKACGSECTVEWSPSLQKYRLRANYCHNRHCEPCMRAKANKIARNLKERLKRQPRGRYRFITLTLRHSDEPLAKQIRFLYDCFRDLRKSKCWKKTQHGGAAMLEVKHTGKAWHPHLHIVGEGKFLRQNDLRDAWEKITGGSIIVHIRQLDRAEDAAHYVTKYVTKSTCNSVWSTPDLAQEWITASKGVRSCGTYGTWRGFRLLQSEAPATDWVKIGTLDEVINRALAGEEHARTLLSVLRPPGLFDAAD